MIGKSVLASVVIDEIQNRAAADHAFFYCKDGDSERNSYAQILRALLSQLISQNRGSVPYYHDEGIQSGDVSLKSTKLSKRLIDSAVQNLSKGFIVIDGIDECAPGERKALLEHLIQLIDRCDATFPGKVRLMILSREEPDIKKFLAGSETLRITSRDTLEDINTYIKYQASRLKSRFGDLETEDLDYIKKCVLDRTDGKSFNHLYLSLLPPALESNRFSRNVSICQVSHGKPDCPANNVRSPERAPATGVPKWARASVSKHPDIPWTAPTKCYK